MKQVNLRLTELTLAAIDELRGIAARNAWIAQAVDEKIARDSQPILEEEGRRLASRRDDLIASGVSSSDLAVPLAPITVPEPKPSKSPPKKEQPVECDHRRTWRVINGGAVICDACGSIRR